MKDSTQIGRSFQDKVGGILKTFAAEYPKRVSLVEEQDICLQNGDRVRPDFHIAIDEPHERRHYLLECQNRTKTSQEISRKIRTIRGLSNWMTFFFIYPDDVSETFKNSLKAQGIQPMSLTDLSQWATNASRTLRLTEGEQPEGKRVEIWQIAPVVAQESLQRILPRLWLAGKRAWTAAMKPTRKLIFLAGIAAILWHVVKPIAEYILSQSETGSQLVAESADRARNLRYAIQDKTENILVGPATETDRRTQLLARANKEFIRVLTTDPFRSLQQLQIARVTWRDAQNQAIAHLVLPIISSNLLQTLTTSFTSQQLTGILNSVRTEVPPYSAGVLAAENMTELLRMGASKKGKNGTTQYEIGLGSPEYAPQLPGPTDYEIIAFGDQLLAGLPYAISNNIIGSIRIQQHSMVLSEVILPGWESPIYIVHFSPPAEIKWKMKSGGFLEESNSFYVFMPPNEWRQPTP
jgi:hypothetical protein